MGSRSKKEHARPGVLNIVGGRISLFLREAGPRPGQASETGCQDIPLQWRIA